MKSCAEVQEKIKWLQLWSEFSVIIISFINVHKTAAYRGCKQQLDAFIFNSWQMIKRGVSAVQHLGYLSIPECVRL